MAGKVCFCVLYLGYCFLLERLAIRLEPHPPWVWLSCCSLADLSAGTRDQTKMSRKGEWDLNVLKLHCDVLTVSRSTQVQADWDVESESFQLSPQRRQTLAAMFTLRCVLFNCLFVL